MKLTGTSRVVVRLLPGASIQAKTYIQLPLPKSICVAVTVKPVSTTAKNRLETAQPLSTLIQKGLRSIVKRYRTVFVALRRTIYREGRRGRNGPRRQNRVYAVLAFTVLISAMVQPAQGVLRSDGSHASVVLRQLQMTVMFQECIERRITGYLKQTAREIFCGRNVMAVQALKVHAEQV